MSKRLICLTVAVLILCLVSASHGLVIGDFENNMDGWAVHIDAPGTEGTYSETGATLNEHSLKLVVPEGGYKLCLVYNIPGNDMLDAFRKAQKISVDVTRLAAEWTVAGADRHDGLHMVVNAGGDGWSLWEGGYEGWWDPEWVGDDTQTVTWDYSEWLPQIDFNNIWWLEFFLISNYDGYTTGGVYYLDNIQLFGNLAAYDPNPSDGATDVKTEPTLTWKPGANADSHIVYIGADFNDVSDVNMANLASYPDVTATPLDVNSYEPGTLEFNTTYYWRIDDVNAPDIWKGDVWSFTTGYYVTVDDFEDYNDYPPDRIFETWKGGYGYVGYCGNGTGSAVGHASTPYAEQTIVHGDRRSMPLYYDNSATGTNSCDEPINLYYSETERTFETPQDWTSEGAKALTLWFYGNPDNDAGATEQLYVKVNGVKAVYTGDMSDITEESWHAWNIPLKQFSDLGVDLTNVTKLAIGLGDEANTTQGGSGLVFIDDIWLYLPRCLLSERSADFAKADYAPAGYASGDCVIDYRELEIMARDWLGTGYQITPANPGTTNLVAHYPFNGNANDVVGGHNGTTSGSVTYGPGKVGQAILLDGVDDLVTVGPVGISGAAPRTIAGWAKSNVISMPDWINIFGFTGPSGDNGHFDIEHVDVGGNRGYGIHVYGWERVIFPVDLEWHHLAASYDGTTIRWYGDGRLIGSDSSRTLDTPDNVHMGKRDDNDNYFAGRVDEVYIYGRVLSEAEIAWLAGHTSPLSIPPDLYLDGKLDFKDLTVLANSWLEEQLWPPE